MYKRQFQMPHKLPLPPETTTRIDKSTTSVDRDVTESKDATERDEIKTPIEKQPNGDTTNNNTSTTTDKSTEKRVIDKDLQNARTNARKTKTTNATAKTKQRTSEATTVRNDHAKTTSEPQRPTTLEEFKASCEALIEAQIRHRTLQSETRQLNAELQKLRQEVVPFLVRHDRHRVDCSRLSMYISTRITHRPTVIGVKQLYAIIEETLGKESLLVVQREAENRRQQKRQVRETRVMPLKAPRKRAPSEK